MNSQLIILIILTVAQEGAARKQHARAGSLWAQQEVASSRTVM